MSAREELLAHTRSILWRAWSTSPEELASAAVDTLMGLGMLVPEGGAQELDRLRLLADARPADLSDEQVEALADAANRVWADANHDDLCACTDWPESCVNGHYLDEWRSGAIEVGMPAVISAWESMRVPAEAAELARLRTRVEELETFAQGCDGEGCVLPHSSWCQRAIVFAESHNGCTCGSPWEDSPQPHAGHCWLLSPPQSEVEQLRARVAELEARRNDEVAAWLGKKACEYRSTRGREHAFQAEVLERMADKVRRGAIRPARPLEDPHDSPLHHTYRVGRELPEVPRG